VVFVFVFVPPIIVADRGADEAPEGRERGGGTGNRREG